MSKFNRAGSSFKSCGNSISWLWVSFNVDSFFKVLIPLGKPVSLKIASVFKTTYTLTQGSETCGSFGGGIWLPDKSFVQNNYCQNANLFIAQVVFLHADLEVLLTIKWDSRFYVKTEKCAHSAIQGDFYTPPLKRSRKTMKIRQKHRKTK